MNIENWKHDAAAGAVPLTSPRCYIGYISLYSTHLLKPHRLTYQDVKGMVMDRGYPVPPGVKHGVVEDAALAGASPSSQQVRALQHTRPTKGDARTRRAFTGVGVVPSVSTC